MKKLGFSSVLFVALALTLGITTSAIVPVTPSVVAIEPASAFNDIGTRVTITGADFAVETTPVADTTDTTVTAVPTVLLGSTRLADVAWVDTQTLTATVPWGMDAGVYPLTVTNPGGGSATKPAAFEVRSGINTWNAGELNGASVRELRMKPGDPNTLYALAYDVGVFRSRDAGASWTFTSANVIGNAVFTVDPFHPTWLYSYMNTGLFVSKDEGDTWTRLIDSNDAITSAQVFVSPHASGTLFVAYSADDSPTGKYLGLAKSTDGGATWTRIAAFNGLLPQSVAFDPASGSQGMVLATTDGRVFRSADEGVTWSELTKPPMPLGIGMSGYITYNPYRADEIWISSYEMNGGTYKTTLSGGVAWKDVSGGANMGFAVTFTGANDVYKWNGQSHDGGTTWTGFGPWPTWGDGEVVFDPTNTRTVYITNATVGVQKSTDGGAHWAAADQGLAGMRCAAMSVSKADPLRVYAAFNGWGGVWVSDDGTSHWTYAPIDGSGQAWSVLEDPFDPDRVYVAADGGFYRSTDGGATWPGGSWNGIPDSRRGMMGSLAADPFQSGHLLVASRVGQTSTHDRDLGYLYSSADGGASWQQEVVDPAEPSLGPITSIVFDPETPARVYLSTGGNGAYRSTDGGRSWTRIDDRAQQWMANEYSIAIATHPQRVLLVSGDSGRPYYSLNDGATWVGKPGSGEVSARQYVFVDGDSTRLYSPDWTGLHFSGNVGDSWTSAAGVLGSVQNTALAYARADGHTVLYAATTGGKTGVVIAGARVASLRPAADAASTLVAAGIYRRAQVSVTSTFTSTGSRDGWVLESSHTSNRGGSMNSGATTIRIGDDASKRQYRGVLSFVTSGLPDNAVITGVKLLVRRQGVAGGGNPVTKFQGFMADVKNGYLGTSLALQTTDFQISASRSSGPFKPGLSGGWYAMDLTGVKAYVNKTSSRYGVTQIRLRFKLDDDGNRTANFLSIYSGNASGSSRPQLVVTYYVP